MKRLLILCILLAVLTLGACVNRTVATTTVILLKATLSFCCDVTGKQVVKEYTYPISKLTMGDLECTFATSGSGAAFHVVVTCKNNGTEAASGTVTLDQTLAVTTPTSLVFTSVAPGASANGTFDGALKP